ncbi:hypothetical protein H9Q69_012052 [Fusarium xylarioides]|uniref:Uncharacterized protein n=1 Tax=Fusarium xylarioides TaxID=221167 RepID=A0A9P7HM21_9HYPO|nr:hypothetical protein H9Q72_011894 [Fusarium xylarioides]KAG5788889.1 hypothetical protein H9Q69_012052 [Fusarium xylarioides]KAG5803813.1 hypothetical protein H9Q71_011602 [Fusarium xylarioides]KAG5813731.1 hypothetical protein H9Q74_012575 [Fusarium xylarioides]
MSARIARSSMALRPSLPIQRGFRTTRLLQHNEKEPIGPKATEKPEAKGGNAQIVMLGGVGLAIGAFFFLLTGKPEKAKEQPIDGTSKPHERVRG